MAATAGPILPVIKLDINYTDEREKITDFLTGFKGVVPSKRQSQSAMLDFGDEEDEEDDGEGDLEDEMDEMDIGTSTRSGANGAGGGKGKNALKYMGQLVSARQESLDERGNRTNGITCYSFTSNVSRTVNRTA
jgi:hypothetical protein